MWYYNLNNQPAGPVDEAARTNVYTPGRPDRDGLKKLFIWWLVTNCFFALYIAFYVVFFNQNLESNTEFSNILTTLLCLFQFVLSVSQILEYVLVYKLWKTIQDGYESTSAGKAVGFLFIPFFNYYWFFRAYWGLAKDLNKYIDRHFTAPTGTELKKSKTWISLTYLIFMFGGAILYILFIVVFMVMLMGSTGYDPTAASSTPVAEMLPAYIAAYVFVFTQWALKTVMFIDFYRTSDSILKAEEAQ